MPLSGSFPAQSNASEAWAPSTGYLFSKCGYEGSCGNSTACGHWALLLTSVLQVMSFAVPSVPTLKVGHPAQPQAPEQRKSLHSTSCFSLPGSRMDWTGAGRQMGSRRVHCHLCSDTNSDYLATAPSKAPPSCHCASWTPASVLVASKSSCGCENGVGRLLEMRC